MIEPKEKKCEGTGKACGYGCGKPTFQRKYGLCMTCYPNWLFNSPEGKAILAKKSNQAKSKGESLRNRMRKKKKKVIDVQSNTGKYKKFLQDEINRLARMIDDKYGYGCISCSLSQHSTVQFDGGHRFSVGSNETIRFNLHNIHKQCNLKCNNHLSGNPAGYDKGLEIRHGKEYLELVHGLGMKYPYVGIKSVEYPDYIATARKLVRTFDEYEFFSPIEARERFNQLIGIYT